MKRTLAITLSICLTLTASAVSVSAASASAVPILPGGINGKALALDLYNLDNKEPEQAETPIANFTDNPVEAIVQEYQQLEGQCAITENSRFYIDSIAKPSKEIYDTVELIAEEYAAYGFPSNKKLKVTYGPRFFSRKGDILINTHATEETFVDRAVPAESYEMYVGDRALIYACDADGLFYGLVTLMELGIDNGSGNLPCCAIKDGPDLKERTLFLDCARKYFDKEWIKDLIRRSAIQRYNAIELHFSEAEGTRIESAAFPWLTSGNKALTREEVKEIVEYANSYHMDVIPSLDIPGHTQYIVKRYASYVEKHPSWSFEYDGKIYDRKTKGFGSIANHYSYNGETKDADYIGIDLTKEHAVAFIDAMLDDYANLFKELGCDRINISGDELLGWYNFYLGGRNFNYENRWEALEHWDKYAEKKLGIKNGSASDTFINYLNTVGLRIQDMGYRVRVFNDEINLNKNQHIKLDPSIELNYWTGLPGSPMSYAEDGHYMYNDVSHWNFYVVKMMRGADIMTNDFASVNTKNIYNNWNPRSLSSKKNKVKMIPDDQFGGGYFHIWCDHPDMKDAKTIRNETRKLTWCNSTKMWNPEITDSLKYKNFMKFVEKMQ